MTVFLGVGRGGLGEGREYIMQHFAALLYILLFCQQYPSEYRIGKVTVPTLFLSGLNDDLIPPQMMSQLHNVRKFSYWPCQ